MRKICKLAFALTFLLFLAVSLPEEVSGQLLLGPRFGVRIGHRTYGTHPEVEYRVREVPITRGASGRINAIAINPLERREVLVTSESGGLFKSSDGGVNWTHIDDLPPYGTRDVAYLPRDPRFVFVTTFDDFRIPSGAGVWRRDPRGSWRQTFVLPVTSECPSRAGAFGIAIEPITEKIFVATSCGILKSSDRGETWRRIERPQPPITSRRDWPTPAFYAVVALGAGKLIAAGRPGVWYSEDGGETWTRSTFPTGHEALNKEEGHHALSASPASPDHAYVVTGTDGAYKLFYSTTSGQSWKQIPSPEGFILAGGNPFVKVGLVPGRGDIEIYFSEGIELHKLHAIRRAGPTPSFDYDSRPCVVPKGCYAADACQRGWRIFFLIGLDRDHGDARDVALQDNFQLFLANDGGLEKWDADVDCPRFKFTGGGRGGLNAWQLTSVIGQSIESPPGQHLYIGSHDNRMLASADGGFSWPYCGGTEGGTIQVARWVRRATDSLVFWSDANTGRRLGGALFDSEEDCEAGNAWPRPTDEAGNPIVDAAGNPIVMNGEPLLVKPGIYVQPGRNFTTGFEIWRTTKRDGGWDWDGPLMLMHQPSNFFGIAGPTDDPVLYQPTLRPIDKHDNQIVWFTRLSSVLAREFQSPIVAVNEPAMNGFGGLGVTNTWEGDLHPFAVNPEDPDHLIAPDAIRTGMKESFDGGNTWTRMPALTALVTHGGTLRFSRPNGYSESSDTMGTWQTIVSALSFCPESANYVLIGTQEGGLYFSPERGADGTWTRIPNSEQIKPVTGFYWESPTSVYISTNGRGLWHLSIGARTTVDRGDLEFIELCPAPCFFDLRAGPTSDPRPKNVDEMVLAIDGSINDAVVENGLLKSFAMSPGAMAISFVSRQTGRSNVLPTYTNQIGQFAGLPRATELIRRQKVIRGFTFKDGLVKHVIYGDTMVRLDLAPRNPSKIKAGQPPIVDNRPYISVQGRKMSGGTPVLHGPGELQVFGRNFATGRNTPIEIRIDDRIAAQGVIADQKGSFTASIRSTSGIGWHQVEVSQRLATGKQLRDLRLFFVRPLDR